MAIKSLAAGDTEVRFSPTLDQKDLETNAATQNGADARLKVCPLVPVGLRQVLAARTLRRDSPFQVKPVSTGDQPIEHGIGDGGFTAPGGSVSSGACRLDEFARGGEPLRGSVGGRAKEAGMNNSVGTSDPWRSPILPR
jgi:hypothetical protein